MPDSAMSFVHQTGQYVRLTFNGFEPRFYSIANPAKSSFLEIHLRDNGQGSAGHFACHGLRENDDVGLEGPFGDVVWSPSSDRPLILIAGGMGIVPMKALAEEYLARKHHKPVSLYWAVKNVSDLYLDDELKALSSVHAEFDYQTIIGDAIDADIFGDAKIDVQDSDIYVSGPEAMIVHAVPLLIDRGARKDAIFGDHTQLLKSLLG